MLRWTPGKKQNSKNMKRQTLILVAYICALFSLSSCDVDTSSAAWLNNTGWKASLDGYKLDGRTLSGQIRIIIRRSNFEIQGQYVDNSESPGGGTNYMFNIKSEELPEYDYPKIIFTWKEAPSSSETKSIIGIISDDRKSIHFAKIIIPGSGSGDIELTNLDFVRMGLFDK